MSPNKNSKTQNNRTPKTQLQITREQIQIQKPPHAPPERNNRKTNNNSKNHQMLASHQTYLVFIPMNYLAIANQLKTSAVVRTQSSDTITYQLNKEQNKILISTAELS